VSAASRVARAIQDVQRRGAEVGEGRPTMQEWWTYRAAVDELVDEAKDALHLTDDDVDQY
jgi:hypothetical protein